MRASMTTKVYDLVVLLSMVILSFLVSTSCGTVLTLAGLQRPLLVSSPLPQQVLKAGEDNSNMGVKPEGYSGNKNKLILQDHQGFKVKLCYVPISQHDRQWRRTVNTNLAKDKTCQFLIVSRPYTTGYSTFTMTIARDVPTATYFIRAYAYDAEGKTLAFGQTTNSNKTTNLFEIEGVSGHHTLLDIGSATFSTFSVLSLVWFFYKEKRKTKKTTQGMYICVLETTHPRCSVCVLISWFWYCVLEFRLVF
ncbi:hypothetical protein Drorol1_Dr00020753 [Drosera rotundifolia]